MKMLMIMNQEEDIELVWVYEDVDTWREDLWMRDRESDDSWTRVQQNRRRTTEEVKNLIREFKAVGYKEI